MPPYVIAVDPGEMCGWAVAHFEEDRWSPSSIAAGQSKANDWEDWLDDNLNGEILLIAETFTVTARTAQLSPQPRPIEVIGVMKFLARRRGIRVEFQSPSSAKRFASDGQLKKMGLWKPGQDHARDAIRHLVLGMASFGAGQAREEMLQSLV
jgi:hypothetical protein